MTLIMNNLAMSISILAMILSLSLAFLRYKEEKLNRENRCKRMEKKRLEMAEASFDFGKWYTD